MKKQKMDKIDSLNQVAEFHKVFKHPIVASPAIPAKERCELRVSLIAEELKELEQAIKDNQLCQAPLLMMKKYNGKDLRA